MKRRLLLLLLVLNGLLLPLSCVPAGFLLNSVNPVQLVFITEFTVENRTPQTIYVTPVGIPEARAGRSPLPLCHWSFPWAPTFRYGRFPVRAGEVETFRYDHDVRFSELVVEAEGGAPGQLAADSGPPGPHFVIDDLDRLRPLTPVVREAHDAAQKPGRLWPILAVTSAPAASFALLLRWYKRVKKRPAQNRAG